MAYISFQPKDYFNTKLYTGTSSGNQAVTGVGFQPDWIWTKNRVDAFGSNLYDAIRGTGYYLQSNNTSTSQSAVTSLISFDSDGFTVGTGDNVQYTSNNGVAWNWKANGAGSANTDGAINSTVSANTTSGFSIVSYTGTLSGNGNTTVGHGLGVAPKMIITKSKSNGENWGVYHKDLTANRILQLNTTSAQIDTSSEGTVTAPTSSVFTVNYRGEYGNSGQNYIAYCFAEKKGFSKFGSVKGNGSDDGPFIYTGFKPAFYMHKIYNGSTGQWLMFDNKRNESNVVNKFLKTDANEAEGTSGTANQVDFLSNGIKIRENNGDLNSSTSNDYLYMAFAEHPLVASNGIPATAR